ncbi:MAG TPA: VWA domain-containing protein [Vicinamibacterales bacterium]
MKSRSFLAAVLACAAAIAPGAAQQPSAPPPAAPQTAPEQPPLTFRVEVNYVEVDAVVTDAQGNPVTNLEITDFEVLEDGRPQKVTAFSHVDIPVERAERPLFAAGPIEPDVQANTTPDGRLYLIVLDDLHVSFANSPRVKMALRQFIERNFGTNDRAAVVYTSGRGQDSQDFTNSPRLLLAAIDRFTGRNLPSATEERLAGAAATCGRVTSLAGSGMSNDPCEAERGFNARTSMSSIRKLADFMAGVRGRRKTLLFLSEGISYDTYDIFNNRSASIVNDEIRDAIAAATRANVAIYAIDPRGLVAFGDASIGGGAAADDLPNASAPGTIDIAARGFANELQLAQMSLRTLAGETGGFAAVNRNDFADAFARIVRENSSYYVLGYYPANDRRDGRFRKIEVRVKRPGLQVRSRQGYVAPRGRAPAQPRVTAANAAIGAANEAMGSPIPIGGVPITVFAAPFKGAAPNAAVALAVEIGIDNFRLTEGNGTINGRAEVTFATTDREGKPRGGGRHAVDLTLKPETLAQTKERGLRVVSQVDLPPGRYQLRVAVGEEGGRAGSVLYDLEVPDFYRGPLTMSGVAVTSALSRQTPTVLPKNPLADFLPGPPTTAREFSRDDELALFAEFYENAPGAPPHRMDITTTLRDSTGRVVTQNTDERSSTELQGKQGGYGYSARLPLKTLEPGVYVVRVEGRSRLGGDRDQTIGRDVQITVR